jgi:hypothetical protein
LIESTKDAKRGGFQGIKKIKGTLVDIKETQPAELPWQGDTKIYVKIILADASVLEMFPGEDAFTLESGDFHFFIPYALPGKDPTANTPYMRCWVASAEELGKAMTGEVKPPSYFKGQVVTLEKKIVKLFDAPKKDENGKPIIGANGKKVTEEVLSVDQTGRPKYFCFVAEEKSSDSSVKDYIKKLIGGLNPKAAQRAFLLDDKVKGFGDLKDQLSASPEEFAKTIGCEFVDGVFKV